MNLKRKTALSLIWCAVRSGIEQGCSFIIFLFLGRMLTPDDFGLVALAASVIEALRLVSSVGLFESIIGIAELDEETADTAFWTSVGTGVVLAGVLILLAGPIARVFHQPLLEDVTKVMSLIIIVSTLGVVHAGRLARDFGHKALAMRALAANLAGGIAALAVIFAGGGMWALVAQRLAAESMQTVATWIALGWIPRVRFSKAAVRRMAGFGVGITIANLVNGLHMRATEAAVGMYLPVGDVGALRIANRLSDLIQQMVFMPANQVTMVAFSKITGDRETLRQGVLHAIRLSGLIAFPCFLGLAAVAPDLVPWMFGAQWAPSVPILQALCLGVAPLTLLYFLPSVQVAVGRSTAYAAFMVFYMITGVLFTIGCAPYGIVMVAIGLTARTWLLTPLALILLKRGAGVKLRSVGLAIAPPFLAAFAAALPTYGLADWLRGSLPTPLLLVVEGVSYGVVYIGLMLTTGRQFLAQATTSVLPMMPPSVQTQLRRILPVLP